MASELFKFKFTKTPPGRPEVGKRAGASRNLSDDTFKRLKDVIYNKSGIYYNETKKYLLEGRVSRRLTDRGLNSFEEYIDLLNGPDGRMEMKELFKVITINETYFFRAQPQFDAFENVIVPEIMESRSRAAKPVFRIWSAASSSGEEAYTTAILVLEKLKPKYPGIQFQILASDLSNSVLEMARKGVYKEYAVRNIPEPYLKKYFDVSGNSYILNDKVKRMVKFMNLNLYDSTAVSTISGCDVIFCCNVLIYFDLPSKQKVIQNLYNSLNQGGYLFIGYSESLHGVTKAFKLVHLPKAMAYKKE